MGLTETGKKALGIYPNRKKMERAQEALLSLVSSVTSNDHPVSLSEVEKYFRDTNPLS